MGSILWSCCAQDHVFFIWRYNEGWLFLWTGVSWKCLWPSSGMAVLGIVAQVILNVASCFGIMRRYTPDYVRFIVSYYSWTKPLMYILAFLSLSLLKKNNYLDTTWSFCTFISYILLNKLFFLFSKMSQSTCNVTLKTKIRIEKYCFPMFSTFIILCLGDLCKMAWWTLERVKCFKKWPLSLPWGCYRCGVFIPCTYLYARW